MSVCPSCQSEVVAHALRAMRRVACDVVSLTTCGGLYAGWGIACGRFVGVDNLLEALPHLLLDYPASS